MSQRPQHITPAPAALRPFSSLPGPRPWPIVGNGLSLSKDHIHQDIEAAALRYGPLFKLRFGALAVLVVSDHELIHRILRARPEEYQRPERTNLIALEMGLDLGLFSAEGDAWRAQRRMVMASFAPGHVRAYLPSLVRVALRLRKRWHNAALAHDAFDLLEDLMRFTVDAITGLAFGADVNTLETDGDVIQDHLNEIFPALYRRILAIAPYWRVLKLPRDHRLDRSVAVVKEAIEGFIAHARQRLEGDAARRLAPPNLLEAMIVAAEADKTGLQDADVTANVMTMLLAGEDTTANTLAWMIYLLRQHPALLARAQDEVLRIIPNLEAVQIEQLDQLGFVDACIQETMRLKPVAPFLAAQSLKDTVVGDVSVPAGTMIWTILRSDSVSDRFFDNPGVFDPARWLEEENAASAAHGSAKRIAMPFGAGPRVCPGRYLALIEMKLCMATLLSAFDIDEVRTPDGGPAREHMSFTMGPHHLSMRLRRREPRASMLDRRSTDRPPAQAHSR